VWNRFRRAVGGRQHESDLVLIGGGLRRQCRQLLVSGEGARRIPGTDSLTSQRFQIRDGRCLRKKREADQRTIEPQIQIIH